MKRREVKNRWIGMKDRVDKSMGTATYLPRPWLKSNPLSPYVSQAGSMQKTKLILNRPILQQRTASGKKVFFSREVAIVQDWGGKRK